MKRDMDFVRELLLKIESFDNIDGVMTRNYKFSKFTDDREKYGKVSHHLKLLCDAGMIDGKPDTMGYLLIKNITWSGCEYLDLIRDDEIWRKTKESASEIGSFSIEVLSDLARGFIKTQVKKYTQVDI